MGFNKEVFAANLRAARAALDVSQEELAKAAGISKDSIVKYESGDGYTPGADKIVAICRVVRKSPNELMGWKETV
ncbi:helix-turn-helix domain-containing protein [Collinsella aerofaciens]|uniref:helix-turn-helix domain-containing protein n=1 Tax=Collinsella aerofaciens TaxID=74426 RepID=UPI0034A532AC